MTDDLRVRTERRNSRPEWLTDTFFKVAAVSIGVGALASATVAKFDPALAGIAMVLGAATGGAFSIATAMRSKA